MTALRVLQAVGAEFFVVLDEAGRVRSQGSRELCNIVASGVVKVIDAGGSLFEGEGE